MNHVKTTYWIVTGLMSAFMLMAGTPDLLQAPDAVAIFQHLGYPAYLLPFLGTAKILGAICVLVPGLRRLKEWAYAGLVFDVTGALYSHLTVGDPASAWSLPVLALVLIAGSYLFHRRVLQLAGDSPFDSAAVLSTSRASGRPASGGSY